MTSHCQQSVAALEELIATHTLQNTAVDSALQAAGNALQSIVEANEHGVEAIEAAEIEDVEALEAKRADVAKLLKAAKKSKSVFDAAVDAGREAAEAEIKAKQAATQKEQQRMTSAFTAGGLLLERLEDAYQECKALDETVRRHGLGIYESRNARAQVWL